VEENAKDYLTQVGKVVDLSRAEVVRNGDWFSTMSFLDILELCSKVTVAQLLTRDDFAKRYKSEQPIFLHECLYPLMQAWDSVKVRADIELGGTEQLYSFMLARDLQQDAGLAQQIGLMTPILVGLDGVRRMGKSLGNYIGINEPPYEMVKKFMQLPDSAMRMYFELLTDLPLDQVNLLLAGHPKEAKVALAKLVIGQYRGAAAADEAATRWQREIGNKAMPEDIQTIAVTRELIPASDWSPGASKLPAVNAARLLVVSGLCKSTSDARRAISQHGAYFGERKELIDAPNQALQITPGLLLWVGKKRVARLELSTLPELVEKFKNRDLRNRDGLGWGSAISIVECPDIREGWKPADIRLEMTTPEQFMIPAKYRTQYTEFFKKNRQKYGFDRDGTKYMLTEVPLCTTETPPPHLHVRPTKYSSSLFYKDCVAPVEKTRTSLIDAVIKQRDPDSFSHSLGMQFVVCTKDHRLLLSRRSQLAYAPGVWSCSFEEALSQDDVEQQDESPILHLMRRGLHEELGLDHTHYWDEDLRVLSLFLESDIVNLSLCGVVALQITEAELVRILRSGWVPDRLEAVERAFIDAEGHALFAEMQHPTRTYHPTSQYRMLMFALHKSRNAGK
jgi:tyrosyl-tRNA synthetase